MEALWLMGAAGLEGCSGKHRSGPEQPGRMSSSGGEQGEGAALQLGWASGRRRCVKFSCTETGEKALSPAERTCLSRGTGKQSPG